MAQLRQDYLKFVAQETEILIVGPEGQAAFAHYWEKEDLPFVGLPDPDHRVANLYGQQVKLLKLGRLPALLIVDKKGQILYRHYGDSMRDIPPNEQILARLAELNQIQEPKRGKN